MKKLTFILSITLVLAFTSVSKATLVDLGGGLIYDDHLKITWLQDANYAKTSGYDDDGKMNWVEAVDWVDNLVYGGFDDWRLPETADTIPHRYNITSSEMGYMYYENLGNKAPYDINGNPQADWGLKNWSFIDETTNETQFFQNLQPWSYWSMTMRQPPEPYMPGTAWVFFFNEGSQGDIGIGDLKYAWAVRGEGLIPGVSGVPEPATMLLLGLGLVGLAGVRRRFNN